MLDNADYFRYKKVFENERFPLAFVDLDKFDANIDYVASTQQATGKTIRVGTKSIRCTELIRRVFAKGKSAYKGILGFTMEEAAFLAAHGFNDIIVAYPTVQKSDIDLFVKLTKRKKKVTLMIDSFDHLAVLSQAGQKAKVKLAVCIEVDMSYHPCGTGLHIGMRRSPIRTVEQVLELVHAAKQLPGVVIDSVMGYEGHIAGLSDDVPRSRFANEIKWLLKKLSSRELACRRGSIIQALEREGLSLRVVNGGGSGSLYYSGADPCLTEVTAGSAFYCSALFQHYRDVHFKPSAFFALEVVRKPAAGMVTCLGGGYTASGAAGAEKLPVPVLPAGLKLLPLEGGGEVQTPLTVPADCPPLELGDPVFFQHAKAGELCERFNELYLVQGEKIVKKVKTYRGEGKAFL